MLFSLINTPTTYQKLINNIFRDILDKYIIIYLDNILIYLNRILKDYIIKIKKILKQFNNRRLLFKPEKYKFHQTEIKFLRYIIKQEKIYIDLIKIKTILEWSTPTNIKKTQEFLGFANFNQQFIRNYFRIIKSLIKLI